MSPTTAKQTVMLAVDFTSIEKRLMLDMSATDRHLQTAAEVFGIPGDQVTPEQRRQAKRINYGVIYGNGRAAL